MPKIILNSDVIPESRRTQIEQIVLRRFDVTTEYVEICYESRRITNVLQLLPSDFVNTHVYEYLRHLRVPSGEIPEAEKAIFRMMNIDIALALWGISKWS